MTRRPVVVGAGLAGLTTALRLAPEPCVVLSGAPLGSGAASGWAQGGIAAALGPDDSSQRHTADTLAAGAGLCDPEVVAAVTGAAPEAVAWLSGLGARFDRDGDGYALGLEGAHDRHRIVHAAGDGSGAEIMRAVVEQVRRTPSVTVLDRAWVERLVLGADGGIGGLVVRTPSGRTVLETGRVVLATGGSGGLWEHTTNPRGAVGSGLALAARAGAVLRDLEMVQFHPTALDVGLDPMPLVSEAVRGEGAVLLDGSGGRLLAGVPGGDLAARDVVARAVHAELAGGGRVLLDAREALGEDFAEHFPAIARACLAAGIDPAHEPIPVRPAAHYHCGGVLVDAAGRTRVPGLWAVGEVSSTGLHGANRLASNSLLEAVVQGGVVAEDVRAGCRAPSAHGVVSRGTVRAAGGGRAGWGRAGDGPAGRGRLVGTARGGRACRAAGRCGPGCTGRAAGAAGPAGGHRAGRGRAAASGDAAAGGHRAVRCRRPRRPDARGAPGRPQRAGARGVARGPPAHRPPGSGRVG